MILTPAPTAKQIHVSASAGNDANPGTVALPVKTIVHAMTLIRAGQPDWVLLKNGDSFDEFIGGGISGSGPSSCAVITSYGDASLPRPKIVSKTGTQLILNGSNLAIIDIDFDAGRDPTLPNFHLVTAGGGVVNVHGDNVIIEGCRIQWGCGNNLDIEPIPERTTPLKGIIVRRNVFAFAYSGGSGFSQGIHTDGLDGAFFEENFVHQNGWNPHVAMGTNPMFNHGVYNSWNVGAKNAYFRWNIFSNNCSSGLQQRAGGTCHNNLFLNNGTAEDWNAEGDFAYCDSNVSTTSVDCPKSIGLGSTTFYTGGGFQFNAFSGYMGKNIVCHGLPTANFAAFTVSRVDRDVNAVIPPGSTIEVASNVCYDHYFDGFDYVSTEHPNLNIHDNVFALCHRKPMNFQPHVLPPATALTGKISLANNRYDVDGGFWWQNSPMSLLAWNAKLHGTDKVGPVLFVDSTRTIESYIASLGIGHNYADFVALALQQRKGHYDKRLVAYSVNQWFQEAFALK